MRYSVFARYSALLGTIFAVAGWAVLLVRLAGDARVMYPEVQNLEPLMMTLAILFGVLAGRERKGLGRIGLLLGILGFLAHCWTAVGSRPIH